MILEKFSFGLDVSIAELVGLLFISVIGFVVLIAIGIGSVIYIMKSRGSNSLTAKIPYVVIVIVVALLMIFIQ